MSVSETVSTGNHGVIRMYHRWKGFGFILDKDTRQDFWFSSYNVIQSKESLHKLGVGAECLFDVEIRRKGRRPNTPVAVNVRTLSGEAFHIYQGIMT
ncbi:hypothetical protein ACA910_000254 [Epithemia clementina (nom. ined.)]